MMEYKEFVGTVVDSLPDYLNGFTFKAQQVDKLQGESYYGVLISKEDSNISAAYNLGPFYKDFCKGSTLQEILPKLAEELKKGFDLAPVVTPEMFTHYENVLPRLFLQMIPQKGNEELLQKIPHKLVEDMAMVYRIDVAATEAHSANALVWNNALKAWGVTPEQLYQDAMIQCPKSWEMSLRSMSEVLAEIMGIPVEEVPQSNENHFYVATCHGGSMGSGCICYPDFMDKAANLVGGNFYLLPSSIHECLVLKESSGVSVRELEQMVREINRKEVAPEDRLSDNVFHYDAKNRKFEKGSAYALRLQQEMNRQVENER